MTQPDDAELLAKKDRLLAMLAELPSVAVAFSGGVDSAVVAKAAFLALGEKALAVTGDSPSVARADFDDARRVAAAIGIRHVIVKTDEFADTNYLRNDGTRCYFCKSELYSHIVRRLPEWNVEVICSGANLDDAGDFRPGLTAAAENHVRHPLMEAGFTKKDVRRLAKYWQLDVWDKPASPCLSSRIAPGVAVTHERTSMVERAEVFLKSLGLRDGRVRFHDGDLARIEVPLEDVARLAADGVRDRIVTHFQALGFKFIALDLAGFRSGSLNELISIDVKAKYHHRPSPVTP